MDRDDHMEDIHLRILRVTEDLRAIQQSLNYAAMQAPGDPELMEALNEIREIESIQNLKSALDQMRHFLWFYTQVMNNESEIGEKLRQSLSHNSASEAANSRKSLADGFKSAVESLMLHYLADSKNRKPN
jgi:hypothetical protein